MSNLKELRLKALDKAYEDAVKNVYGKVMSVYDKNNPYDCLSKTSAREYLNEFDLFYEAEIREIGRMFPAGEPTE